MQERWPLPFQPLHSSISGWGSTSVHRPRREKLLLPDLLIRAWSGSPVITIGIRAIIVTFGFLDDGRVHRGLILSGSKADGKDETTSGCTIQVDGRRKHPESGDDHSDHPYPSSRRRGKGMVLCVYLLRVFDPSVPLPVIAINFFKS